MSRRILYGVTTVSGNVTPIYAIEGHNVNLKELVTSRKIGMPSMYCVRYKLLWHTEEIVTTFIDHTEDFRTLIFTNPVNISKTIGIPIMNIISCEKVK